MSRSGVLRLSLAFAVLLPAALAVGSAHAEEAEPLGAISGDLSSLSDADVDLRIRFLEERLDAGRRNAQIWQYGFTGGYSLGAVIGVVQASTDSSSDARARAIVTAVKATIGTARLLLAPHPARHGADAMREVTGESREDRIRRLAAGEGLLQEIVDRTESRWSWKRHAANLALNAAGAAVGWPLGDRDDALIGAALGIVVGEIMTFTMPWRSIDDAKAYRQRIGLARKPGLRFGLTPLPTGLALRVDF